VQLAGGGLQARGGIEVAADQNGEEQPLLLALAEGQFRGQRELRRLSRALRRQERLLTAARGLPERAWFRHQIYAPGRVTGYAAVFLPALDEAIEDGDAAIAEEYRDLIDRRLERATAVLEEALP
jgi:N-acetylated-alpha-linked acidic dipeptidase